MNALCVILKVFSCKLLILLLFIYESPLPKMLKLLNSAVIADRIWFKIVINWAADGCYMDGQILASIFKIILFEMGPWNNINM